MKRARAVTALALSLALAPVLAHAGDPARDGLGRLRAQEQRNRLEDLSIDARRRLEAERLRATGTPPAQERTRRRWQGEDDRRDFRRDREREALRRRVDAEERLERAPRPALAPGRGDAAEADASRAAFDRALREADEHSRLDRLRRDAWSRSGPGVRRWPR